MKKIPVGVLGATGTVGQKFILHLVDHPWFEITALAASDRSVGQPYAAAASWKQRAEIPESVRDIEVQACEPGLDCRIVFSGLSSSAAGPVEESFARAGYWVFSNARNYRMEPDVPLLIAEINPDHLDVLHAQRKKRGWTGAIVTNPNCSTIILALALHPIHQTFGLEAVHAITLQAISGAGYPGVASLDILGNIVPFISGEEEKIENETRKILGKLEDGKFVSASFGVSAQTNRVPVEDGHLECVSVKLRDRASPQELARCLGEFQGEPQELALPSAPRFPLVVLTEDARPQPRLDVEKNGGMSVFVGRIRPCPLQTARFVILGHNTIRGAAGASILNAELALKRGLLS